MSKILTRGKFMERVSKYEDDTAEAIKLAFDMMEDLVRKYPNFEIYFIEHSAGLRVKKTKDNRVRSYLKIEVSQKRKPGLYLSKDRLLGDKIDKDIINQVSKYSGPLEDNKAPSKKEQIRLFFKYFEEIIKELDQYILKKINNQNKYLDFFNEIAKELKMKMSGIKITPKIGFNCQWVETEEIPERVHFEWSFTGKPVTSLEIGLHSEKYKDKNYNKRVIEKLEIFKQQIEDKTKEKLIVEKDWGTVYAKMFIEKKVVELDDELRNWAVEKMKLFIEVLRPELDKINNSFLTGDTIIKTSQARNDEISNANSILNKEGYKNDSTLAGDKILKVSQKRKDEGNSIDHSIDKSEIIIKLKNIMYQPETHPKNFTTLFSDIDEGIIKIPQFQRDFVWSKDKSAKLIDSIIKGYPIGTFILWKTKETLRTVRNIGGIELPETPRGDFIEYVLDGQQRITSIYASLRGLVIKKYYDGGVEKLEDFSQMYIDLEAGEEDDIIFTNIEEKESNKALKLYDLLNSDLKYLVDNYPDHINKISDYRKQLESYNFTIVTTREIPIDVATEIFTRLNTGGKPLSNFEIMVAKTFDTKTGFDLAEQYDKLIEGLSKVNYGTIPDSTILQVVSVLIKKECKKNVILKLEKNMFIKTWPEAMDAIKSAVDYFRNQYRIKASQLLPYNALIVPFAYFFHNHPGKPTGLTQKYLLDFFWRVSLSDHYSSSLENRIAHDIKRIDCILKEELPTYDYAPKVSEENIEDGGYFSVARSYVKAILCIYSYFLPRSFSDNSLVTIDNDWLKAANSKNYHHFFPKAFLTKKGEPDFYINHVANITIVDDYLNKREIKTKAPSVYMRKFKKVNHEITETMKSHLINSLDRYGVWENNYDKFFNNRIKAISRELKKRIIKQKTDYKSDENLDQKISTSSQDIDIKRIIAGGESDSVEFKASLRWDYKQKCINKQLLETVIAKTIAAFMNSSGGILLIGVDDEGRILGLEKDYENVQNKNSDGFKLLLDSMVNNYLGSELHEYIKVEILEEDDKSVCAISIQGSDAPVFVKDKNNKKIFVVRGSASTLELDSHDTPKYIKNHW